MLRLYPVILSFVADIAELVPRIAHHDPDLARQLRRSSASVGGLRIPRVVGEDRAGAIGGVHRSPAKIWATRSAAA